MKIEIEVDSVKMLREYLCIASSEIAKAQRHSGASRYKNVSEGLDGLIRELDKHRPVGSDGKHGKLHTETCGCDEETKDNDFWEGVYYE